MACVPDRDWDQSSDSQAQGEGSQANGAASRLTRPSLGRDLAGSTTMQVQALGPLLQTC